MNKLKAHLHWTSFVGKMPATATVATVVSASWANVTTIRLVFINH
jgi:hypothetical protein